MAVQVILAIWSGRPNPQLYLNKMQVLQLNRLLDTLVPGPLGGVEPKLGYAGFLILGYLSSEISSPIRVVRGIVKHPLGILLDRGSLLERWFIEIFKTVLEPEVYDSILREL
jgi:hypothetical protein